MIGPIVAMTDTPHPWNRRAAETAKAYAAFRFYCELGSRRSVREAARQNNITRRKKHTGEHHRSEVARLVRLSWLARTADEQVVINIKACLLALTETALTLLKTGDSRDFLRAARALSLHFPPVQRVEDVSERFDDLSDMPDTDLERMKEIRDAARLENCEPRLTN